MSACLGDPQVCDPARGYRCPVHFVRPPAPPLSLEEQEVVDRFEAAPDPFAEDCRPIQFSDPFVPDQPLPYCAVCTTPGGA